MFLTLILLGSTPIVKCQFLKLTISYLNNQIDLIFLFLSLSLTLILGFSAAPKSGMNRTLIGLTYHLPETRMIVSISFEGTCNFFAFFQPLMGWRHLRVTQQRTNQDFALCMQYLVDVLFPEATTIRVVLDNLNTHTDAALYQTFEPETARRILNKERISLHTQAW